jgi:hypothetical protein
VAGIPIVSRNDINALVKYVDRRCLHPGLLGRLAQVEKVKVRAAGSEGPTADFSRSLNKKELWPAVSFSKPVPKEVAGTLPKVDALGKHVFRKDADTQQIVELTLAALEALGATPTNGWEYWGKSDWPSDDRSEIFGDGRSDDGSSTSL